MKNVFLLIRLYFGMLPQKEKTIFHRLDLDI